MNGVCEGLWHYFIALLLLSHPGLLDRIFLGIWTVSFELIHRIHRFYTHIYTSPSSVAQAAVMATATTGKFNLANSRPLMRMPLLRRMSLHNKPANDAENENVMAPKLEPSASAYTAPVRVRGRIGGLAFIQNCSIRASKMVHPMLVPQI